MATNPSTAMAVPENENGIAIQVSANYNPNPSEKAKNVLRVAQAELGWAFKSSRQPNGWVICQIGIGRAEDQRVGKIEYLAFTFLS